MELTLLRKSVDSQDDEECPAMYTAVDLINMVAQGERLDANTAAQLLHRAANEDGVLIPIETVLRSVAEFIARHGDAELAAAIDAFVTKWERSVGRERCTA